MNARSKATGILGALFVVLSVFQYEVVIELNDPWYDDLRTLQKLIATQEAATSTIMAASSTFTPAIEAMMTKMQVSGYPADLASNFNMIEWLCYFNLTFLA